MGVRVALDHFGSGSLGLAQLPQLPVDLVKVDRSLFAEPSSALVDVVITLGNRLGFEVAAVGVESEAELATLRAAGCATGQGNLLGAPGTPSGSRPTWRSTELVSCEGPCAVRSSSRRRTGPAPLPHLGRMTGCRSAS
jgi:EAL domain-containing protein (putative c-di-GMP-specific phosphodiesterase class I)